MYICICKGITKSQLEEKAKQHANPKEVLKSLGVGSDCGTCLTQALDDIFTAKSGDIFRQSHSTPKKK